MCIARMPNHMWHGYVEKCAVLFTCMLKNAIWKWQAVGVYKPGGENESGPVCRWKP